MTTPAEIAKAERLARAIASDISIYNQQKIQEGLENDNVLEMINDDLEEGRKVFTARVGAEVVQSTNIFEKAIVDTILFTRAHVKSRIF